MEFVAERFRRKVVALVYAGSNPVKLPKLVGWPLAFLPRDSAIQTSMMALAARSVHLIGQDYRFSICPHEFESRTDYKRFNSTAVVQLLCNEQVAGSNPA